MSPAGYEFFRQQLDDLLWIAWDPIGVNDATSARDEYSSYAVKISDMLMSSATVEEIHGYLRWAECENMGLPKSDESITKVISLHAMSIYAVSQLIRETI